MRCERHPRYHGRHQPRTPCVACWAVYLTRRIEEQGQFAAIAALKAFQRQLVAWGYHVNVT